MSHEDSCSCTECAQRRLIEDILGELRIVRNEVREIKSWVARKQAEENAADLKADGRTA
jgi:hypothetical protein